MKVGVTLPVDDGLSTAQYLGLAKQADACGYDTVLVGEVASMEVFAMLGLIAGQTSRIRVGSGIVGTYPRTAVLTAMGFATLASYAPGRVLAGIGVSSPIIVERWHGLDFRAPLRTAEEYVALLRQVWSGRHTDFAGDTMSSHGFRSGIVAPQPIPVLLGAMNPRMLRLAGRIADTAFLTWTPPEETAAKVALVREGEAQAGRPPGSVSIAASFWCYAGDRPDVTTDRMRRFVLQYAMVPTHQKSFGGSMRGLDKAAAAWAAGDRAGALRAVDDDAVAAMCAIGSGDDVARRVHDLRAAGVDLPIALTPGAEPGDIEGSTQTIDRLATALDLERVSP